jgi:uncharacterized protein YaaW (UPF0174 family)
MANQDQLDQLFSHPNLTADDVSSLCEILSIECPPAAQRRETLNQEFRHSYGHTLANLFRSWNEPDYIEILKGAADRLKVSWKAHHTVENLEDKILSELIDLAREAFVKEKGADAWKKVEEEARREIDDMIASGKIPEGAAKDFKGLNGGALLAAILAGRLAGFGLYIFANQVFFAIARQLGLRVAVGAAGPIIGKALAFLLGPYGILIGAILVLVDLGNTNWKKILPGLALVISIRRRLQYGI